MIRYYFIKEKRLGYIGEEEFLCFEERLCKLDSNLEKLTDSLPVDPEIDLVIALLKRDIDSIREGNKLLKEEMTRKGETNRWMMGITISICLSLFTLAISILLTG